MTNEELAIQIQLGHTGLYGKLWESCRSLLFMILRKQAAGFLLNTALSFEDLQQEMYFALCKAVQAYDDTKPFRFNSYLRYSVMTVLRDLMSKQDVTEISLNQTVSDNDGKETELTDLISDEKALSRFEETELSYIRSTVRRSVAALPITERRIVVLHYFTGLSFAGIAELFGKDTDTIQKQHRKALRLLRQDKSIAKLYREMAVCNFDYYHHSAERT